MNPSIEKAVFPVAGMGTRFLPATKANPKEMLPIVDKPLIQYAVEEAVAAGVRQLVFVTSSSKRAIEDHFDKNYELEAELEKRDKQELLDIVHNVLPDGASCVYVRQPEALGLGHAVWCAREVVGNHPFAVMLADDLIHSDTKSCLAQMAEVHAYHGCSVLGAQRVASDQTGHYGIVDPKPAGDNIFSINGMVEKPKPEDAPSNLAVVGRYILSPRIFDLIETTGAGAGGEIQLTDAIAALLREQQVLAYEFEGTRYDCGSKLGYLQATVEYAMRHTELKREFSDYLRSYCTPERHGELAD